MCGIAGYAGWKRTAAQGRDQLRAMCDAIVHRGPDEDGTFVAPGVALGMRRLQVIDPAGGRQPIANEDGTVRVVFNGEIYNYRELRGRLAADGHRFTTSSDTETLVHLYEEEGDRLVHRLRGMFAFAIWDARRERLLAARDRVGIKPLYYWETADGVAFASELRSFLALPHFPARVAPSAVASYLAFGYVPDPGCIFEGVRKLPPGHSLTWSREDGLRVEQYWTPIRAEVRIDEQEAVEELRRLLDDAVRSHLVADVPLGAFLSGGVDSSAVVALMARHASSRVKTFSIGFDEARFNEAPHAAATAAALGTEHTELIVRPDADAIITEVVRGFDEPFADSSAIPMYLVSQLARRHVTVALSGDGGDELFGGYTRYLTTLARQDALPPALRTPARALARRLPHATPGRNRLLELARSSRGLYASRVALPLELAESGVARPELAGLAGAFDQLLDPWFDASASRDFPTQMMMVDLQSYLPGDILTKVDRMSMAVSLEGRVPLLDHHVVEFAAALPSALKIVNGTGKHVLRRAVEGIVPSFVLERRKQGFGVPLADWFRDALRHRVDSLQRADARITEYVDASAVRRLVREHLSMRRDHSYALWRLLVLDLWLGFLADGSLCRPSQGDGAVEPIVQRATTSSSASTAA